MTRTNYVISMLHTQNREGGRETYDRVAEVPPARTLQASKASLHHLEGYVEVVLGVHEREVHGAGVLVLDSRLQLLSSREVTEEKEEKEKEEK